MLNRPRKPIHGDNDLQALYRQLNNDFEVHTYLHQHQLDLNNTQSYAQLLNTLILGRRTRTKHLRKLKTINASQSQPQITEHQREFEQIEERTGKQQEITNNLEREITETKKSLNLLKGDIGFLVSRNQSSKLLGSKVTKVKIVAQNQLKRVAMAFTKDKQQIKIRNEMQKKFSKKLKNICNYESTSLSRLKQFYVEGQLRSNQIYNKLYESQQAAQNGEEMAQIQRQKQKIDSQNRDQQLILLQLQAVIKHFSQQGSQQLNNVSNLLEQIQDFLLQLQLPLQPDQQQVNLAVDNILKEYHSLKDSLKTMSEFYNQQLIAKEQLTSKVRQCEHEQHELFLKFQLQALYGYIISQDKLKSYNQKLKKFASILKSYFMVLSYLQKYEKHQEVGAVDKRRFSSFTNDSNIKYATYITQLHKTFKFLSSDEKSPQMYGHHHFLEEQISYFYENLVRDVKQWLFFLKSKIAQGNSTVQRRVYQKPTTYSQASQLIIPSQVLDNERSQQNPMRQTRPDTTQTQSGQNDEGFPNRARRIRLLQDVDRDYYKMIKATMKMEKENTRKNYQFQRVFKRAKYASRDDILQQKRFQASFSVLFTKQSSPAVTRAFGLQSRNSSQPDLAKTMHLSIQSNFKPKTAKAQPKKHSKPIIRRSIHEQRQKKARLNQKLKEALVYSDF